MNLKPQTPNAKPDSIDILTVIPQRPPFVMIGQLLHSDEKLTRTSTLIRDSNALVEDGYFSEAGLTENMAQTAAAGAGYRASLAGEAVKDGYIGAIRNLEIFALPAVGDTITTEVRKEETVFDITAITGKVMLGNKLLASCEMKIFTRQ